MILKKIALVACSNPITDDLLINKLTTTLTNLDLTVVHSNFLLNNTDILNRNNAGMAKEILDFFKDDSIDGIFDISGGDLCNGLLDFLDFNELKKYPTPFFGYSDLTVLLNALYTKSETPTFNYQILNILKDSTNHQLNEFKDTFIYGKDSLFNFNYSFLKGDSIEGIVVGGNIRCLLKLAGTDFFPNFDNKILLLESCGGDPFKLLTFLNQYNSLGVFKNLKGIILGEFTEMERKNYIPTPYSLVLHFVNNLNIPIIKTSEIGHSPNSKCIGIGKNILFEN